MHKKTIAVVGAGVSGLAFARRIHELSQKNGVPVELAVLEGSPRAGGVVETQQRDGFLLENGPDSFLSEDPAMLDLCRRLGLEQELIGTEPRHRRTFVVQGGRLQPLPEGFYLIAPKNIPAFLASPLFSPAGKLRMLAERLVPRFGGDKDESIASFVRRRFGREALERVGQPMIAGVYSGDPEELSLMSTMPRFHALESEYGSVIRGLRKRAEDAKMPRDVQGVRYSLFVSFRHGMQTLTDALASRLPAGVLRTGFKTASVSREPSSSRWTVVSEAGEKVTADALCLAVSARAGAVCLKEAAPGLAASLDEISYESVATLNLAFDAQDITHPLDGFGFVVPSAEGRPIMACTFAHRKFSGRARQGKALLRAFVGGAFGRRLFHNSSDAEIEQIVLRDLQALLGGPKKPLFSVLKRHPQALPQYHVGHRDLLRRLESAAAALPGLALTGSSYRGTGLPDCARDAEACAERLWRDLGVDLHRAPL